jgi:hypothetical protein
MWPVIQYVGDQALQAEALFVSALADGMIVSSRRLLAYLRAGDGESAALERWNSTSGGLVLHVAPGALPGRRLPR